MRADIKTWIHKVTERKRKQLFFSVSLMLISFVCVGLIPFFVQELIDEIILQKKLHLLWTWVPCAFGIVLTQQLCSLFGEKYLLQSTALEITKELRNRYFGKIIRSPLSDTRKYTSGSLISRILQDTPVGTQTAVSFYPTLCINTANIIIMITVLLMLNVWLTLAALLVIPISYLITEIPKKRVQKYSKKERLHQETFLDHLKEKLDGINTIKVFNKENYFENQFLEEQNKWTKILHKMLVLNAFFMTVRELVFRLTPIVLMSFGALLITQGNLTLGTLTGFLTYLDRIYQPIGNLLQFRLNYFRNRVSIERLVEMDKEFTGDETDNSPQDNFFPDIPADQCLPSLSVKNLMFSYPSNKSLIKDFSENFYEGEITVIRGENGSGKSTLLNIIAGLEKPLSGSVEVFGTPNVLINSTSLAKAIGYSQQFPFIFSSSMAENIFMDDEIDSKIFEEQLTQFGLRNRSKVSGKCGNEKMSGGEKQKINLMRVLLRQKKILLFDEPTNFLDTQSLRYMKALLSELKKERTILISSHDKKISEIADRIIDIKTNENTKRTHSWA